MGLGVLLAAGAEGGASAAAGEGVLLASGAGGGVLLASGAGRCYDGKIVFHDG